jgi:hypothetical protein
MSAGHGTADAAPPEPTPAELAALDRRIDERIAADAAAAAGQPDDPPDPTGPSGSQAGTRNRATPAWAEPGDQTAPTAEEEAEREGRVTVSPDHRGAGGGSGGEEDREGAPPADRG